MSRIGHPRLLQEALLALLVLSLAFLNFGHTSAVFAAGGRVVVTAHSVCGDPGTLPSAGDHFACHGCRPDAAVLPPEPCAVEPAQFGIVPVIYPARSSGGQQLREQHRGSARGPPLI